MNEEEITYGEDFIRKIRNRGKSVAGYCSKEDKAIWDQLKRDCLDTNRMFYYSNITELLHLYDEMRRAVAPIVKKDEDIIQAMHDMAKNINVFESDEIEIKAIKVKK